VKGEHSKIFQNASLWREGKERQGRRQLKAEIVKGRDFGDFFEDPEMVDSED